MKNAICFLIPTITFAVVIGDLGKSHHSYTYSAPPSVILRSDTERAVATYNLKD